MALTSAATIPAFAQARQLPPTTAPSRTNTPASFACDPNHLTSYTGVVERYVRDAQRVLIVVHTDWGTTQAVDIKPASPAPVADRAVSMFRVEGRAFSKDDWTTIEQSPGTLRTGTRATIRACDNGNTMVEWNTPRE